MNLKNKPHNIFFLIGFIYYLITPLVVGNFELMSDMPAMNNWHKAFYLSLNNSSSYIFIILAFFVSFYTGSILIDVLPRRSKLSNHPNKKFLKINLSIYGLLFLLTTIYISIIYREVLFSGYQAYDISILGMLGTINSVGVMLLLFIILNSKKYNFQIGLFYSFILYSSIILIGLGSRIYVLIPIVAMFVYKFYYSKNKWTVKKVFALTFSIASLLLIIGAWRIGASIDLEFLLYLLLAEPTFTWWSAATFLANNELVAIDFPSNFLSSFSNFLPSFLNADKSSWIYLIQDKYFYEAPLGADSLFVNIQGNFGWYFGSFYMFLLGLFYSFIERLSRMSNFYLAYYICIVAVLPFQIFRDNFGIVNKQLFWNMLLVPSIIIFSSIYIKKFLTRNNVNGLNIGMKFDPKH
jgi:hypothetical protein